MCGINAIFAYRDSAPNVDRDELIATRECMRSRGPDAADLWMAPDGRIVPATGKSFELEFCTVARWKDGEIVEENLFYDQVGFLKQIGVI